jgi:hypothetical protein
MSSAIAFSLTAGQRDYLVELERCGANWPSFNPAIAVALERRGLVRMVEKPELTELGRAAAALASALTAVKSPSMSSRSRPVVFALTFAQLRYLAELCRNPESSGALNPAVGLALVSKALVMCGGPTPHLTNAGKAAAALALLLVKAKPLACVVDTVAAAPDATSIAQLPAQPPQDEPLTLRDVAAFFVDALAQTKRSPKG